MMAFKKDEYWSSDDIPSGHLTTMLIALQKCGKTFDRLVFHRAEELMQSLGPVIQPLFLKHLVIDTSKDAAWTHFSVSVSDWILRLPNLEILTIRQCHYLMVPTDLCKELAKGHWPKLRRLELRNVHTSLEGLRCLIDNHIHKLAYFSISIRAMFTLSKRDMNGSAFAPRLGKIPGGAPQRR